MFALTFITRWWREGIIAVLVLGLVAACHARDNSLREQARAEVLYRQADSVAKALAPQLARVDTQLIRDTVRVPRVITQLQTLRDTLIEHKSDTTILIRYVTRADSVAQACTELSHDCTDFRRIAYERFAADSIRIQTRAAAMPRSCVAPAAGSAIAGAITGFLVHSAVHSLSR